MSFAAGLAWPALSWLLVAIAVSLFPYFGMPDAAVRGLLYGLLIALPAVLALAWRYEVTARGVVRITASGGAHPERMRTGRRLDQLTVALVLLALSLSAIRQFVVPAAVEGRIDETARSEVRDGAAEALTEGGFRVRTIKPGAYPVGQDWSRPPHLHYNAARRGFRKLTTQMYFAGDPLNDVDRLLGAVPEAERAALLVSFAASEANAEPRGAFTLVLRPV